MRFRAACRSVAVLATVALTSLGIAGQLDLQAAVSAPARVMGSKVVTSDATATTVEGLSRADEADASVAGVAAESTAETVQAEEESGTGVWAVVVGIDDYPGGGRDLRAGVADAGDMGATLDAYGVAPEQRRVLLDGAATRTAFVEAMDWLAANVGRKGTALVFFSGHVREVGGDPDGDGEATDEVMVFADDATYSDGELRAALDRTRAGTAWVVMAGCFGGGFDDVVAPGRILTAAAPEGLLAYENDRLGNTYLVEYMLNRGLLTGAATTVQDAFSQAVDGLRLDYPNRLPVIVDQVGGPLTLSA